MPHCTPGWWSYFSEVRGVNADFAYDLALDYNCADGIGIRIHSEFIWIPKFNL